MLGDVGEDGGVVSPLEFDDFRTKTPELRRVEIVDDETPEEALQAAYQTIRDTLASEIIAMVKASSPSFFERLVLDLMLKMGYGGSREKAGSLKVAPRKALVPRKALCSKATSLSEVQRPATLR